MILLGDKNIPYEVITKITKIDEIVNTKANSTLLFEYNQEFLDYCCKNSLKYAVIIKNLKEAIYANALEAKYIICNKEFAKTIQEIADNYMFDSKILAIIQSNEEFEEVVKNQIDGIIYKEIIN
ncbi:hypothetical protein [Malaciobacter mytili]|uniref:RCK N-terminal domain-containing protein n=1 Tax=Malaciobacter mytili LMG 24559 TaxID=1032238 RepID=A0AAX2AI57_9BACT|nr:hypothetical protein [Malaciobacter mytili]AXH15019.1 hypothetical protein AMYT_1438 [Malaciobacter mytili LMG 24559]RXI37356.1 hypothetical protein CRU99_11960 [Malaciobacter mytili]RXK16704.1 hypothetical protein CP985_01830 [Malaciobacter mytili LMG 24559]